MEFEHRPPVVDTFADAGYGHGSGTRPREASIEPPSGMASPPPRNGSMGSDFEVKVPDRVEDYDVVGTLFKKRGGWGKHLGWRARAFTLYQGYISYYEAESLDDVERTKPRGVLNLKDDGLAFYVQTHKSHDHPPTEYIFQLAGAGDTNKWKMCALNKEDFDKWVSAITKIMGPPVNPRSTLDMGPYMGRRSLDSADAASINLDSSSSNSITQGQHATPVGAGGHHHHAHHHHHDKLHHEDEGGHMGRKSTLDGERSKSPPQRGHQITPPKHYNDHFEIIVVLLFVTVSMCWARLLSGFSFAVLLVLLNAVVGNSLLRKGAWGSGGGKGGSGDQGEQKLGGKSQHNGAPTAPATPVLPSKLPPIGSTVPKSTVKPGEPGAPLHSWNNGSAVNFKVRMGPHYKQTGRKEPSGPALYDLIHLDVYKTLYKVCHIGKLLERLPEVKLELPPGRATPKLFIVNCQLPSEPPGLLNSPDDGPGYNVVFYFALKQETATALADLDAAPPAIRLVEEYFRIAPDSPEFRGRFKAMAQIFEVQKLGMPGFIEKYNGKPVLITKSGSLIRGKGYMEMDINVHRFGLLAKKGLHYLQEKFKEMQFEVGFTVEGRDDSELPEIMLGVGQLNNIDVKKAVELTY